MTLCGTAIAAATLSVVLRQYNKEYSLYISLAASLIILFIVTGAAVPVIELIKKLSEISGVDAQYIAPLMKALAISYITQLASDCCKDSGENAISSRVDFAGKIAVLLVSLPLFEAIIGIIEDLII